VPSVLGGLWIYSIKDYEPGQVGHKSTLKHAQERASHEVSQGRQCLIFVVLRAGKTRFGGPPRNYTLSIFEALEGGPKNYPSITLMILNI
jgi:hypothetical protein